MHPFKKMILSKTYILTEYPVKWLPNGEYCITQETSITELTINSSEPTVGGGMLDFLGGEPNEILQLLLNVTIYDSNFASLDFDSPLTANSIGINNLSEGGSISLDSNGNARVPYHYINTNTAFSCSIQITGRSSLKPIPEIDRTIITNS